MSVSVVRRPGSARPCGARPAARRTGRGRATGPAAFSRAMAVHRAGSPAAMRVVSRKPVAANGRHFVRQLARPAARRRRCGRWLVVARARSCSSGVSRFTAAAERLPEQARPARRPRGSVVGGRRQDADAAGEQVGRGRARPPASRTRRAGGRRRTGRGRGSLPSRSRTMVALGAAGVGEQGPGHGGRGRLADLPGDRSTGEQKTTTSAARTPAARSVVNSSIAPSSWARASVSGLRPTPTTWRAAARAFAARPTDPPISPTPTMASESKSMGQL